MKKTFVLFTLLICLTGNCFAQKNDFNLFGSGETFVLDEMDAFYLSLGLGLSAGSIILDKFVQVKDTSFDGNILNKDNVSALDRLVMNPYSDPLHKVATGIVCVQLLSPALLALTPTSEWFTIGTMYAEAFFLAYGIKDTIKAFVYKPRPYMYFDGYPEDKVRDGDWCKSFPSGHTTNAFLGASFTSFVFSQYFPDSPWKYVVIGTSYAAAILTGCLRIASGNHFITDVLVGAAIGSFCGFVVPALHTLNAGNQKNNSKVNTELYPLGVGFSIKL